MPSATGHLLLPGLLGCAPPCHGTLLPTLHQPHLTLEPTFGFTGNVAPGFMFLNAWEPGEVFSVNPGAGFDPGSRGPGAVLKSRFEWDWRTHPGP